MGEKKKKKHDHNHKNNEELREMLKEAIEGETTDFAFYNTMANMVEDHVLKAIILGVAGDEYGHARSFRTMLELYDCIKTV